MTLHPHRCQLALNRNYKCFVFLGFFWMIIAKQLSLITIGKSERIGDLAIGGNCSEHLSCPHHITFQLLTIPKINQL